MKTLKYFFIICFVISITTNSVARSVTYQRFSDGTLTEKPETTPKVVYETMLHFSEQCPPITDEQVKILVDSGSVIVSKNLLVGHGKYSSNLFYFTPQYKITRLVITNSNNDVRRTFSVVDGATIVSLWFIFGVISILLFNFSFYLVRKVNNVTVVVVAVAAVEAAAVEAAAAVAAVAVAVAVAAVAAAALEKHNKFLIWLFNIIMIIFMVLCYFQI